MESDQYMPEYWSANRIIGKLEKALIEAKNILGLIQSSQIANLEAAKVTGLLTSEQIKEIEAAKIAGQLTSAQIKELEAAKITGQITSAQIKELEATKISGKLTNAQLEAIDATKILGKLTNSQIESIEAAKLTGEIKETQIGNEAISTAKIKAGSVTAGKIAAEAVTSEKIAALTIIAGDIASNAITAEKILAEAVESSKIKAEAITATKLAAESVEASKIKALAVTAGKIAAEAVTAEKIAALAITAGKIAAEAVTTEKLAANSVSAAKIVAGSITAEKLSVVSLSSISANLGTITAGTLKAVTIEGATGSFTGKVTAEELDLNWGAKIKEAVGSLRWLDSESKEVRAIISASSIGSKTYTRLTLETNLSTTEEKYQAELNLDVIAPSTGEGSRAGLRFKYKTYADKLIFGDYHPKSPPVEPNRPEASDWVQQNETRRTIMSFGETGVTFDGVHKAATAVEVEHKLPTTPTHVYVWCEGYSIWAGNSVPFIGVCTSKSSTKIGVSAYSLDSGPFAAGNSTTVKWIAVSRT